MWFFMHSISPVYFRTFSHWNSSSFSYCINDSGIAVDSNFILKYWVIVGNVCERNLKIQKELLTMMSISFSVAQFVSAILYSLKCIYPCKVSWNSESCILPLQVVTMATKMDIQSQLALIYLFPYVFFCVTSAFASTCARCIFLWQLW